MECLFCKIVNKEIKTNILYEDEYVIAFYDIHPVKPIHILIVTKKHIADISQLEDDAIWASIRKTIQKMVKKQGLENKGFRVSINGGGAQDIQHVHVHVMGPIGFSAKF